MYEFYFIDLYDYAYTRILFSKCKYNHISSLLNKYNKSSFHVQLIVLFRCWSFPILVSVRGPVSSLKTCQLVLVRAQLCIDVSCGESLPMQPSDSSLQELLLLTLLKCLLFRWEVLSLGCWQSYFLQSLSPWLVDSHLCSVPTRASPHKCIVLSE